MSRAIAAACWRGGRGSGSGSVSRFWAIGPTWRTCWRPSTSSCSRPSPSLSAWRWSRRWPLDVPWWHPTAAGRWRSSRTVAAAGCSGPVMRTLSPRRSARSSTIGRQRSGSPRPAGGGCRRRSAPPVTRARWRRSMPAPSERRWLEVVRELAVTDFRLKYNDSALGYAWSMLSPLAMLAIYYFVFRHILGERSPGYAIYLLVGVVYWTFVQDCTFSG